MMSISLISCISASMRYENREIPAWVDDAVRKAVHLNPCKRYDDLSGFLFDLRHPDQAFLNKTRPPLLERNPAAFWKGLSFVLGIVIVALLSAQAGLELCGSPALAAWKCWVYQPGLRATGSADAPRHEACLKL